MDFVELKSLYNKHFWIGGIGNDFSNKLALLSLICYLFFKLKQKKPDLTYWEMLYKIGKDCTGEDVLKRIAIICESESYGCNIFPNFGIEDKKIPGKIQELLREILPF